jgi:imidazolonepropionase-like amidohydrolase
MAQACRVLLHSDKHFTGILGGKMSEITVFTAKAIHTMEPSHPHGTAIAVRDGQILEVGTPESLKPWLDRHAHKIDTQFADKVLLPGLSTRICTRPWRR